MLGDSGKKGQHDIGAIYALNAKINAITKLMKGNSLTPSTSTSQEAFNITCDICGEKNHLSSYCTTTNPKHIAAFNSRELSQQVGKMNTKSWQKLGLNQAPYGNNTQNSGG